MNPKVIGEWLAGIPVPITHIVSLLGRKKDGFSEFDYYPFRSEAEQGSKPTFQAWLNANTERLFKVHEIPTVDRVGVPAEIISQTVKLVLGLLAQGDSVLVVDSAGAERTARVCEAMGYRRHS